MINIQEFKIHFWLIFQKIILDISYKQQTVYCGKNV